MSDYADKIAERLVNEAQSSSLQTNPPQPIDWLAVVAAGVRAGYVLRDGVGK